MFRPKEVKTRKGIWTKLELKELRNLAEDGLTAVEIAQRLYRSPGAVEAKARNRVHIRIPTYSGNKKWLLLKLRNLRSRSGRLLGTVRSARSTRSADDISQKMTSCQIALEKLTSFAKKNKIDKGSYQITLLAIQDSLERIRTTLGGRRAAHWEELAKVAATVIGVFNSFLILLKNLGLITLPLALG